MKTLPMKRYWILFNNRGDSHELEVRAKSSRRAISKAIKMDIPNAKGQIKRFAKFYRVVATNKNKYIKFANKYYGKE